MDTSTLITVMIMTSIKGMGGRSGEASTRRETERVTTKMQEEKGVVKVSTIMGEVEVIIKI